MTGSDAIDRLGLTAVAWRHLPLPGLVPSFALPEPLADERLPRARAARRRQPECARTTPVHPGAAAGSDASSSYGRS